MKLIDTRQAKVIAILKEGVAKALEEFAGETQVLFDIRGTDDGDVQLVFDIVASDNNPLGRTCVAVLGHTVRFTDHVLVYCTNSHATHPYDPKSPTLDADLRSAINAIFTALTFEN